MSFREKSCWVMAAVMFLSAAVLCKIGTAISRRAGS